MITHLYFLVLYDAENCSYPSSFILAGFTLVKTVILRQF